ncbi:hypothetical protein DXG03_004255 [Asterophora parasitica]|uniref:MINDY deubiquitinase domain-containing protein n=1 Tax=Asterophora parasitica TaxID=117018 RepID=A0A9P7G2V8_9AGAR|nr:hypothetical protein DXG03_004255 [Asterophora parasitica]
MTPLTHLAEGLDLNPLFTWPTSFKPATETAGGELELFSHAGIDLVHGWLVDPDSPEAVAMREEQTEDYDSAVALIAEADHIAGGLLVPHHGSGSATNTPGRGEGDWSDVERRKVRNALTIRHYLEQTQSQLTYHGLFHLASTLPAGSLVALFRSSHLSVLYKSEGVLQAIDDAGPTTTSSSEAPLDTPAPEPGNHGEGLENTTTPPNSSTPTPTPPHVQTPPLAEAHDSALYSLATDQVFLNEPSVVWERIEDVDGSAGVFVDSQFVQASPAGGDWAGRTAEDLARDIQREQEEEAARAGTGLSDHELARQLQAEEEHFAQREREQYRQQQQRDHDRRGAAEEERRQKELHARREKERRKQEGKKKDCIIM